MSISVLVAEDHTIVREGLCYLVSRESDMQVVAEAENGLLAVQLAKEFQPDVVVMDVSMPDMNGIEATRFLKRETPGCRVLVLSMHADRRFVVEVLRAGAVGYILKDCASESLVAAIRSVVQGESYLSPKVAFLLDSPPKVHVSVAPAKNSGISSREREVLQLLAEGKNTKEIAYLLEISTKTVETHRKQIMCKLKIHSVAELTKYAVREGLTSLHV